MSDRKVNWTGDALRALGNVSRDPEILESLYEEACSIANNEECGLPYPQVFVGKRHVHAAASVVQRRINERQRLKALAIDNRKAACGGAQ
jgi:hypothetical protein